MGVGNVQVSDLDWYVSECDRLGGPQSQAAFSFLSDFYLDLSDISVKGLDPFSAEYYAVQMGVYKKISGREIDQHVGEQYAFNVDERVRAANPYNSRHTSHFATHSRAISAALSIANLPYAPSLLDLGSGWGLSSEIMAYLGANVTAVDINPHFVDLVNKRAVKSGLPIAARLSSFDDYSDDKLYDAAVFYECMHHSLKVWETLAHIGKFVKPGGKIIFAGEPITDYFWKDWGVRTDCLSVYCIRKWGWFESGWSAGFLLQAFRRAGFDLRLYPHAGMQNTEIGIATRFADRSAPDTPESAFPFAMVSAMKEELKAIREALRLTDEALQTTQVMHHALVTKTGNSLGSRLRKGVMAAARGAARSAGFQSLHGHRGKPGSE